MRNATFPLIGALAVLCLCQGLQGAVGYSVGTGSASYQLSPGASTDVSLWLTFSAPDTSQLLQEVGLLSAGLLVHRTNAAPSNPVAVLITDLTGNEAEFDDPGRPTISVASDEATLFEMRDFVAHAGGVLGTETFPGSGIRRVYLGELTVTAGTTIGTVTFQVTDNTLDDTVFWTSLEVLDDDINSTSFDVTVVPEPATMSLIGLAFAGIIVRRRHKG